MVRAKYESALVLQPIDMLRMHTLGGAQVLGIADKVGSLETGKLGDILVIDPKAMDRAPVFDPAATLVFACNSLNLEKVFVGGEMLVDAHHPVRQDYTRISAELSKRVTRLNPPKVADASAGTLRPLLVGSPMPGSVTVQTEQRHDTTLAQTLSGRPAMLIFHRGGWCPYCDMQLAELRLIEPQLKALGYQIVAVTPDGPAALRRRNARDPLGYTLLSDESARLTEAFGVATRVDREKLGPLAANIRPVLPVPSVFIVDAEGVVRFQHVNPDYRVLVPKGR
jgi:peroxiredoxin